MWWRVLVVALAYLLIGAHFLRYGHVEIAVIAAAMPLMIVFKHKITNIILQGALITSSIFIWGISAVEFINTRIALDAPWMRLAAIMLAVILFTLFAAYCCKGFVKRDKLKLYHS